jgi:hypothetical protein
MRAFNHIFWPVITSFFLFGCKKNENVSSSNASLVFRFAFDPTQARLNNLGQPSIMAPGRAGQSPRFNGMSVHYIELAKDSFTPLGLGKVIYKAGETTTGGANAIDFSKAIIKKDGEEFFRFPVQQFHNETYKFIRISLAYQNYDIDFKLAGMMNTGTIASFIGYNTYVTNVMVKTQSVTVNANKAQGFWAFEALGTTLSGQAPPGATTVPNPLFFTSPIPAGSCVVTAQFENLSGTKTALYIGGNEAADINLKISLSTNKSFEWQEVNADGIFEPNIGENVVDMGIRGLKPIIN